MVDYLQGARQDPAEVWQNVRDEEVEVDFIAQAVNLPEIVIKLGSPYVSFFFELFLHQKEH